METANSGTNPLPTTRHPRPGAANDNTRQPGGGASEMYKTHEGEAYEASRPQPLGAATQPIVEHQPINKEVSAVVWSDSVLL